MPKFLVYHNNNFISHHFTPNLKLDSNLLYLVAEVECENLEEAFRLTNHIDQDWWNNPEIRTYYRSRSTSVGDLIYNVEHETLHRVDSFGFSVIHQETIFPDGLPNTFGPLAEHASQMLDAFDKKPFKQKRELKDIF